MKAIVSIFLFLALIFFSAIIFLRPLYYSQPVIHGLVVDRENDKPVEGAIVLVSWQLTGGLIFETSKGLFVKSQIAVSDEQGMFSLPGWDRKWRRWRHLEYLRVDQPRIRVLSFAHGATEFSNYLKDESGRKKTGLASETIKIARKKYSLVALNGTLKARYLQFFKSGLSMNFVPSLSSCKDFSVYKEALLIVDKWKYIGEKLEIGGGESWLDAGEGGFGDRESENCIQVVDWLKDQRTTNKDYYENVK